jgi:hypothetical protein
VESDLKEPPPVEYEKLIAYLFSYVADDPFMMRVATKDKKNIIDSWGNKIVLIYRGENLLGLGSKGADGKWNNGGLDDVVYLPQQEKEGRVGVKISPG